MGYWLHLYRGIDWATARDEVAVVDADGHVLVRPFGNGAAGFAQLLTLLTEAGDTARPDAGGHRN